MNFPDDADGSALRRLSEHADLTKPVDVDFMIAVPDWAAGEEVARLAAREGYETSVERDDVSQKWTCYCKRRMIATYDAVVRIQRELDELSRAAGGYSDGWGSFGNSEP